MRRKILAVMAAATLATAAPRAQQPADEATPPPADGDIVVPGQVDVPAPTPPGDPRSRAQRMRDIRAWDRCLIRAQAVSDADPTRYQADTPEQLCRERLGMADRTAVPISRAE